MARGPGEEDPKEAAKQARKYPETERLLRQFLHTDGPKGATEKYREGWERNFAGRVEKWPECCGQRMKLKVGNTLYAECQRCGKREQR